MVKVEGPFDVNFWQKQLRAQVIAQHVRKLGQNKVVCFTCGNAARALEGMGLQVIAIGPNEGLVPKRWFSYTDIAHSFPGVFDATSGHLPLPLLKEVAQAMVKRIPIYDGLLDVPTGSGETLVCLAMAYPTLRFKAVRGVSRGSQYHAEAPLNALVEALTT